MSRNVYRYLLFYKPYNVLSQFTDKEVGQTNEGDSVPLMPVSDRAASAQAGKDSAPEALPELAAPSAQCSSDSLRLTLEPTGRAASRDRSTLKDYIPVPSVYPVGRLDRDSEGLLLLTNNGRLQHRLSDRRFRHPRTYWVQVEGLPDRTALSQLKQGVVIQNYRTRPALVQLLPTEPSLPPRQPPIRFRKTVPTSWLEITLTEGRNRQVRKMTAAVGFPTLRLVRVAIAHLRLDSLEPGQWRDLTPAELEPLLGL